MVKKLQMQEIRRTCLALIGLLVFGIFLIFLTKGAFFAVLGGSRALERDADLEELTGEYVSWKFRYALGEYLKTTETGRTKWGFSVEDSRYFYVVGSDEMETLLCVDISEKRYDEIEYQIEQLHAALKKGIDSVLDTISVKGTLRLLEGRELNYLNKFLRRVSLPETDIAYGISDGLINGQSWSGIVISGGGFVICLLFSIAFLIRAFCEPVKKKVKRYLAAHPWITPEELERDFAGAERFGKIWIGRTCTYCYDLKDAVLDNSEIIWVHTEWEQLGRSSSYYIYWGMLDGSEKKTAVSKKLGGRLEEHYRSFPHIVVGDAPDYGYMFKHSMKDFLALKYSDNAGMNQEEVYK